MYRIFFKFALGIMIFAFTSLGVAERVAINHYSGAKTQERQEVLTPQQVLLRLQDGNERFVNGRLKNRDLLTQLHATKASQYPLAVILNCMDSRTTPELIFDQGLGDIFAIRVAGNIINDDILGSMEFGTKISGAKVIAVVGHTNCGAMRGACQRVKLGHLSDVLQKIKPAVDEAIKQKGDRDCSSLVFIDEIAKDNVLLMIKEILKHSPVIREQVAAGQVEVVGGLQDITTGRVSFFGYSGN